MSTTGPAPSTPAASHRKLTVNDIADIREYEREREQFRSYVVELKRRRRISLGTIITVLFENRDTMRFQIQEMARVERITTDQGIQDELDVYNPLIPEPGQLCATLFVELTSDDSMREWLPKLVGIEQSLVFRLGDGTEVRCTVDPQHASQLTREHVTAAVHYVSFEFTPAQVAQFREPVTLVVDHPSYHEEVVLLPATIDELRTDLLP